MINIRFCIHSIVNGKAAIYVKAYIPGSAVLEVKSDLIVEALYWNAEKGRSEGLSKNQIELNIQLDQLERYLKSAYKSGVLKNEHFNVQWLLFHVKNCFKHVNFNNEVYILRQIELYIESAPFRRVKRTGSLGLSKNTVRNLKQFYELVESFERDVNWRIDVTELDHIKTEQFRTWLLQTKGYSLNNAGLQFKLLKMICREAEKRGVAVHHYTRHIESFNLMPKDRFIHTLSFEEINRIRSLDGLPANIENSRKWMLIGLHIGQRVSDLLSLQPSQIRPCTQGL